jgi:hypothetical protein
MLFLPELGTEIEAAVVEGRSDPGSFCAILRMLIANRVVREEGLEILFGIT